MFISYLKDEADPEDHRVLSTHHLVSQSFSLFFLLFSIFHITSCFGKHWSFDPLFAVLCCPMRMITSSTISNWWDLPISWEAAGRAPTPQGPKMWWGWARVAWELVETKPYSVETPFLAF